MAGRRVLHLRLPSTSDGETGDVLADLTTAGLEEPPVVPRLAIPALGGDSLVPAEAPAAAAPRRRRRRRRTSVRRKAGTPTSRRVTVRRLDGRQMSDALRKAQAASPLRQRTPPGGGAELVRLEDLPSSPSSGEDEPPAPARRRPMSATVALDASRQTRPGSAVPVHPRREREREPRPSSALGHEAPQRQGLRRASGEDSRSADSRTVTPAETPDDSRTVTPAETPDDSRTATPADSPRSNAGRMSMSVSASASAGKLPAPKTAADRAAAHRAEEARRRAQDRAPPPRIKSLTSADEARSVAAELVSEPGSPARALVDLRQRGDDALDAISHESLEVADRRAQLLWRDNDPKAAAAAAAAATAKAAAMAAAVAIPRLDAPPPPRAEPRAETTWARHARPDETKAEFIARIRAPRVVARAQVRHMSSDATALFYEERVDAALERHVPRDAGALDLLQPHAVEGPPSPTALVYTGGRRRARARAADTFQPDMPLLRTSRLIAMDKSRVPAESKPEYVRLVAPPERAHTPYERCESFEDVVRAMRHAPPMAHEQHQAKLDAKLNQPRVRLQRTWALAKRPSDDDPRNPMWVDARWLGASDKRARKAAMQRARRRAASAGRYR